MSHPQETPEAQSGQPSQRQRLIDLLTEMGVSFELLDNDVVVDEGKGYSGFLCAFEFDEDGNAAGYGCWE
jgi:hypothetical protein